jgi:hypothetical protein
MKSRCFDCLLIAGNGKVGEAVDTSLDRFTRARPHWQAETIYTKAAALTARRRAQNTTAAMQGKPRAQARTPAGSGATKSLPPETLPLAVKPTVLAALAIVNPPPIPRAPLVSPFGTFFPVVPEPVPVMTKLAVLRPVYEPFEVTFVLAVFVPTSRPADKLVGAVVKLSDSVTL